MWTPRPEKKEEEEVLQAQKQILPYSPQKRPEWSSCLHPVEEMATKQVFPCKAWRGTHRSRYPHCTSTGFFLVLLPEEGINGDYGRKEVTLRCLLAALQSSLVLKTPLTLQNGMQTNDLYFDVNTFIWNTIIHAKSSKKIDAVWLFKECSI